MHEVVLLCWHCNYKQETLKLGENAFNAMETEFKKVNF